MTKPGGETENTAGRESVRTAEASLWSSTPGGGISDGDSACGGSGSVGDGVLDLSPSRCNFLAGGGFEDGDELEEESEVTLCLRRVCGVIDSCGSFCDTLELLSDM